MAADPLPADVLEGVVYGAANKVGTYRPIDPGYYGDAFSGSPNYGPNATLPGWYVDAYNEYYLTDGPIYGPFNGTYVGIANLPLPGNVTLGPNYGPFTFPVTPTVTLPQMASVSIGTGFGPNASYTGSLDANSPLPQYVLPAAGGYGFLNLNGTYVTVATNRVRLGTSFGPNSSLAGTFSCLPATPPAGVKQINPQAFGDILLQIKASIVERVVPSPLQSEDQIVIVDQGTEITTLPPRMVMIQPRGLRADRNNFRGGGRASRKFTRMIDVYIRNQWLPDVMPSAEQFLTNPTNGIFALEEAICDAVDGREVIESATGCMMTIANPELIDSTDARRSSKSAGAGMSMLSFTVSYQAIYETPPL